MACALIRKVSDQVGLRKQVDGGAQHANSCSALLAWFCVLTAWRYLLLRLRLELKSRRRPQQRLPVGPLRQRLQV